MFLKNPQSVMFLPDLVKEMSSNIEQKRSCLPGEISNITRCPFLLLDSPPQCSFKNLTLILLE